MIKKQPNNPLHGIKLTEILEFLIDQYGFKKLAERININCFKSNPTYKSCLKFLRTHEWARKKVVHLYLDSISKK